MTQAGSTASQAPSAMQGVHALGDICSPAPTSSKDTACSNRRAVRADARQPKRCRQPGDAAAGDQKW